MAIFSELKIADFSGLCVAPLTSVIGSHLPAYTVYEFVEIYI